MVKKIAIVSPNSDTFTNPTMSALFNILQQKGVKVYLFGPQQFPGCPATLTNIIHIPSLFKLNLFRNPRYYLQHWLSYFRVFRTIKHEKISVLLGVDPLGIIVGGRIRKFFGKKIHLSYLSFEIFFKEELSGHYLKLKEKEIKYSAVVDTLLVQDEKRLQLLLGENKMRLTNDKVALVPVSPLKIEVIEKPDLYKKLNIPREKKLAVYSGSVGEWCGTKAIIEAFNKGYWNTDFWLVFHTRNPIGINNEFYSELNRLDSDEKIPFTMHPHPFEGFEELAVFLSAFDLALALYYPNNQNPYYGKNMKEIGLSSGKFSMYMMLGLPTIVTDCEIFGKLIKKYRFGAVIKSIDQLKNISEDDFSKKEALSLYNDLLDPEKGIIDFLRIIGFDKIIK
jgi:hypothetical protein